jgi:hypothetical protein
LVAPNRRELTIESLRIFISAFGGILTECKIPWGIFGEKKHTPMPVGISFFEMPCVKILSLDSLQVPARYHKKNK